MSCVKRGQDQKGRVHVAYSCEGGRYLCMNGACSGCSTPTRTFSKKKKKILYKTGHTYKKTGLLVNKESDLFVSLLVYLYTVLLRNVCVAFLF